MASKTVTRSIVKFYSKNLTKFFTCYDCYPCEIPPLPLVLFPRKHGRTRLKALLNFRYVRVYMNGLHPLFSMAKVVVIIKKLSGNGQKPPVNVKQNAPTKWGSQQRTKVPFTIRSIRTTFISFLKEERKNRKRESDQDASRSFVFSLPLNQQLTSQEHHFYPLDKGKVDSSTVVMDGQNWIRLNLGPVYMEVGTPSRWGNPLRWVLTPPPPPPVHIISHMTTPPIL